MIAERKEACPEIVLQLADLLGGEFSLEEPSLILKPDTFARRLNFGKPVVKPRQQKRGQGVPAKPPHGPGAVQIDNVRDC